MSYMSNPEDDFDVIREVHFICTECEFEDFIEMDVFGNGARSTASWSYNCPDCGNEEYGDVEL